MLHSTCGELRGGARLAGAPAAQPAWSCTLCTSLGQRWWVPVWGKAVQRTRRRRMLGARKLYLEPPRAAGWGTACSRGARLTSLPSLIGLGARQKSRRRDTWEERGGRFGPSFKAKVCFQAPAAEGSTEAPAGPCRVRALWEAVRAWPGSSIPMAAGTESLSPSPQPGWSFSRSGWQANLAPQG